jgi:hypothetical protein
MLLNNPSSNPNFGFSAAPVGSLSVTLSWQAVPGATGFTLFRDGNSLGSLPATNFAFVDRTVKPFGQYSYHLRADGLSLIVNGRPSAIPLDSPTIVVNVPPPVTPNSFAAQLIGGNIKSVKLTWNPVLEASAYEIDFGGRTVRVPSNAPPTIIDPAPNNRDASYAIRTLVQASDGSLIAGYWSSRVTIRVRPFVLVVAGDSIMWGQGLLPDHKFKNMFRQYLSSMLGGRDVKLFDHSHSGAILGPEPDTYCAAIPGAQPDIDCAQGHTEITNIVMGEVPDSYPSIPRQALVIAPRDLQQFRLLPDDVDLVLMDGCINDVNVGSLLNPATSNDQIASTAVQYCNQRMTATLTQIHAAYKNAKVLVTGYYTIISPLSTPLSVFSWASAIGGIPLVAPAATGATTVPLASAAITAVWVAGVAHSRTAFNSTDAMLQSAILNANTMAGTAFAKYVRPGFQDVNAFAAPQGMLWLLPIPPTPPNAFDEVLVDRQTICKQAGQTGECNVASVGHPNAAGALTYENALIPAVNEYLPLWRGPFSLTSQLPGL